MPAARAVPKKAVTSAQHVERPRAFGAQTAVAALAAAPDAIEARLRGVQEHVVVGADAEFEIAPAFALAPSPAPVKLALPRYR